MKILYLSPVPYEGAGCRFRIYQYLPYLKQQGFKCSVSPFLFKLFFKTVYKKGRLLPKLIFFAFSFIRRIFDLARAVNYDLVVIYRESFPIGPPIFEYLLKFFGKKIIFDYDDAIFLPASSEANSILGRLRCPDNTGKIIKISKGAIAGNSYLRDYGLQFNPKISIIPTVIDTDKFRPAAKSHNQNVVIGWTGTSSTQGYLLQLKDVFKTLLSKYPEIEIRIIGAADQLFDLDRVIYQDWSLDEEVSVIQDFCIGLMPLPDTEWARGKCGFKMIQYMACGIPAVATDVGANKEIIQNEVNGFLVSSADDWLKKISFLIENPQVRQKMGIAARGLIEEKFSLKRYKAEYAGNILRALNQR
ncbi:glycosyltransferase family 4 protein [Candidatus Omnitrophota bacterium]